MGGHENLLNSQEKVEKYFNYPPIPVNFNDIDEAADIINAFVKKKTNNKILQAITSDSFEEISQFVTRARLDGIILLSPISQIDTLAQRLEQDNIPYVRI